MSGEVCQPIYENFGDSEIAEESKALSELEGDPVDSEEYREIHNKFVNCKATKELLDDLEKLAEKGLSSAAIDIGHYAIEDSSEQERAKKLLKNVKDPYATHLLGLFALYEDDEENALELFFKAREMGVNTSLDLIILIIEGNPDLKQGKYAQQIEKALHDFHNFY